MTEACTLAAWQLRDYALGERVLSTCKSPYNGLCASNDVREFECQPTTGELGRGWCKTREPGVGNGWQEAWQMRIKCNP